MIFDEQIARKPNHYPWAKPFIEAMRDNPWSDKEFSFVSDLQDYTVKLSQQEKTMIVRGLSTIGQLEISVKKYWSKLGDNLPHPALYDLGHTMAHIEVIHGDAYERLLEVLGLQNAFDDTLKMDIIKGRVNYLKKHLHKFHADNRKQFVYSLILFTIFIENLALFSQFYMISWFGRFKNVLKDTNKQVEYTSREENLHATAGIKIINVIREEHPELFDKELEEKVLHEAEQAVKYECEIVDWIVNGYGDDTLNSNLLKHFIKNRLNISLEQIGYKPIFEVDKDELKKTLWFDEQVVGNTMTDFFHSKPTEYSKNTQSFDTEDLF